MVGSNNKESGKTTHEYGHYVFHSMLADYTDNPNTIDKILLSYLGEQIGDVGTGDETNIVSETLADFFASQVHSCTNYFDFDSSQKLLSSPKLLSSKIEHSNSFCIDNTASDGTPSPCADRNHRKFDNRNYRQRNLVELIHDAVDHEPWTIPDDNDPTQTQTTKYHGGPTNANAWDQRFDKRLEFTDATYGEISDEDVAIGGPAIKDFAKFMALEGNWGNVFSVYRLKDALASILKGFDPGDDPSIFRPIETWFAYTGAYNWCDACDLFVLHDENVSETLEIDNVDGDRFQWYRWEQCIYVDSLAEIVGAPPHPNLRMDENCKVCPARHTAEFDAVTGAVACEPCANADEVVFENDCVKCAWNEQPVGDDCVPCPYGEHFDPGKGKCESCPENYGWDDSAEYCTKCEMDQVIWLTDLTNEGDRCETTVVRSSHVTAGDDNCPHELWVAVFNLDDAMGDARPRIFETKTFFENPPDEQDCSQSKVSTGYFGVPDYGSPWDPWTHLRTEQHNGNWETVDSEEACDFDWGHTIHFDKVDVQNGYNMVRIKTACTIDNYAQPCEAHIQFRSQCPMAE